VNQYRYSRYEIYLADGKAYTVYKDKRYDELKWLTVDVNWKKYEHAVNPVQRIF